MDGPNWAQIVSAIGGLAGFTALLIELWTRTRRRNRPPDGLLDGLLALDNAFSEIIAPGGQRAYWFLDDERRRQENLLAIVSGQIVDKKLVKHVDDARSAYSVAFAASSDTPRQHELQLNAAMRGRAECASAIRRANELLRKYQR